MNGIGYFARATPDAAALVSSGSSTTFGELDARQRSLAGLLRAGGVGRTDRIALLASNRPEIFEVTGAALRAGIVPVIVNALLTPSEVAYIVEDSGARWLFTDRPIDNLPELERVITFGDAYERSLFDTAQAGIADVTLGRPMHYTSGTTGLPKGVWVEPVEPERATALAAEFCSLWGIGHEAVYLLCSPLAHSAPHRYGIRTLEAGGTVVVQTRFDPEETLAAVELFGITITFVVPTHLERILALGPRALGRFDLSTMRRLVHAGAPLDSGTKKRIMRLFPQGSVWEFYGCTEGQATCISPEEWLRKPGSVGRALPGTELRILGEDLQALPTGETGAVYVGGRGVEPFEYWGAAGKTKEAWHEDAFTVGDLGHLDEDGYLYLSGRAHDTIISGGVNVYPQEVERVLAGHDSVAEVAVYGAPHPEWGEQVAAMIVPHDRETFDEDALVAWARVRLAGYKCPRLVSLVDELPRTATGKITRPARGRGS